MKKIIFLFFLYFFVEVYFLFSFEVNLKISNYEGSSKIRIIISSKNNFECDYLLKNDGKNLKLFINKNINKLVFSKMNEQSKFIKNVSSEVMKEKSVIILNFTDSVKLIKTFTLKIPRSFIFDFEINNSKVFIRKSKDTDQLINVYINKKKIISNKGSFSAIETLFSTNTEIGSRYEAEERKIKNDIELLKNDIGLKLIGDYAYNSSLGMTDAYEGPYRWRVRAGFDWDFLNGGLLKRNKEKKLLKKELNLLKTREYIRRREESYYKIRNYIVFVFSREKIKNLNSRIKLLNNLLKLSKYGYLKGINNVEELINIERKLYRAKNLLENYKKYYKEFLTHSGENGVNIRADDLPVVKIKIDNLLKEISSPVETENLFKLEEEKSSFKNSFFYDMRLKTWLYYYHYNRMNTQNRFFSMGIQLRLPFPFSLQKRKENAHITSVLEKLKFKITKNAYALEISNSYDEYMYKMDDLINFLKTREILINRLRKEIILRKMKRQLSSDYPILKIILQIQEVDFELLHIRQEMYQRLNKIFRHYNGNKISKFLKWVNISKLQKIGAFKGDRFVYIWSNEFNSVENDFIIQFLISRDIYNILLSAGKMTNTAKLKELISKAKSNGIKVYAVLSTNEWSRKININSIKNGLASISNFGFAGIHIDIEPHTFKDWQENKRIYIGNYGKIITNIKRIGKNYGFTDLSLAIPLRYISDYKPLFKNVSKIFLMVYGKNNIKNFQEAGKKISSYNIKKRNMVIVLRLQDFYDEAEMEEFIDTIVEQWHFGKFAFHSMKNFLNNGDY